MNQHTGVPGVTNHFVARAVERIGCSPDEAVLAGQGILWAIRNERWDIVRFVSRVARDGRRIFKFRHSDTGRCWYALVDTERMLCITVLPAGFRIPRQGKSALVLKEDDI